MHYDLGIFHRFAKNFVTRLNLYYIDIENYIVANGADVYHASGTYGFNMDQIEYSGVEFEFDTKWFDKLNVFGNYSYRKTEYEEREMLEEAILLTLAPEHKANLGFRYRFLPDTVLSSDIRYVGERESEGNVYNLDPFWTMDMSIDHEFSKNFSMRAYVTNIFREDYQEVYGFPMPKDAYGISLKMSFF